MLSVIFEKHLGHRLCILLSSGSCSNKNEMLEASLCLIHMNLGDEKRPECTPVETISGNKAIGCTMGRFGSLKKSTQRPLTFWTSTNSCKCPTFHFATGLLITLGQGFDYSERNPFAEQCHLNTIILYSNEEFCLNATYMRHTNRENTPGLRCQHLVLAYKDHSTLMRH